MPLEFVEKPAEEPKTPPPVEPPKPEDKKPEDPMVVTEKIKESLKARLRGLEPKKEEPKKEEEKKEEPKDEKKPEPEKKEEPGPEKKAESKKTRRKEPESEALKVAQAALELARERTEPPKPEPELKKDKPEEEIPEQYQEDLPVLQAMEKKFPDKYKGIAQKFVQASKRTEDYRMQWEKENPGKEFNPQDEEHNAFFEKNDVTWNDRDYARTLAAIETEAALAKHQKKTDQELEQIRAKELERDLEPQIRKAQAAYAKHILTNIDKELGKLVSDDGQIVRAEADRLREEDPIRFEIVMSEAVSVAKFVREVERLFHESGKFDFDEKNPVHHEIYNFAMEQEAGLRGLPLDQQINESGQRFATRAEYMKMSPEQQRRHWRLEKEHLNWLRAEMGRERASKMIEDEEKKFQKIAEKRGLKASDAPKAGTKEPDKKQEAPANTEKPDGPSGSAGGKINPPGTGQAGAPSDARTRFKSMLRGL